MWHYYFFINYIEFQAPQNCSSTQPCTEGMCFILRSKQVFLPFKIQKSFNNYQIYDVNGIKKNKMPSKYDKIYNENSGLLELSMVLPLKNIYIYILGLKITLMTSLDFLLFSKDL